MYIAPVSTRSTCIHKKYLYPQESTQVLRPEACRILPYGRMIGDTGVHRLVVRVYLIYSQRTSLWHYRVFIVLSTSYVSRPIEFLVEPPPPPLQCVILVHCIHKKVIRPPNRWLFTMHTVGRVQYGLSASFGPCFLIWIIDTKKSWHLVWCN
jgi:hypothetical protein